MVKHSIMVTTAMMVMTTMGFRVAAFAERRADQSMTFWDKLEVNPEETGQKNLHLYTIIL